MFSQELRIALRRPVPAFVLHKTVIRTQVSRHRLSVIRAVWNQFCRNPHGYLCVFRNEQLVVLRNLIPLGKHHLPDDLFVLIGLMRRSAVRIGALQQTIVTLCIEETPLVKAGSLEAVIHIGGQNKVILVLHQVVRTK